MSTPISAKLVAELRARTGAGMMDCKKALEETGGNIDEAALLLRKKGIAKAEKRAGRAASEGQIVAWVSDDAKTGVLVEVVQFLKMPDGTLKVFLQGVARIHTKNLDFSAARGYWETDLEYPEQPVEPTSELKALMRHGIELFEEHAKLVCTRRWAKLGTKIYAKALQHPNDPIAFAHALTGVYATDPDYGKKLERIMKAYGLLETFGFRVI